MHDMRDGICPLCQHNRVLEAVPGEFVDGDREEVRAVTYDPRWLMAGRNPRHPHGPLKTYVCRKCGYVQWFAEGPGDIPVGEEYMTRIIEGPEPGAYR